MGILVLALAILPRLRVGGRQLLEYEMPGPEADLTSTIRETANRFVVLYVAITFAEIVSLTAVGWSGLDERMNLYDAVAHSFTTLGTGGFSTHAESVGYFGPVTQWVIAFFLVVAGINFALMFLALIRRRPRAVGRDEELRLYLLVIGVSSAVLLIELIRADIATGEDALRHAVFQTASIITTTGFATADYTLWGTLAAATIVGLMFIGPSAGSTGGSIKVVRHLLVGRILRRELVQTVHPELVTPIRVNGVRVDERTRSGVIVFVLLYVGCFAVGALLLVGDASRTGLELTVFDAVAAAATTLGNCGPGFGFAGPLGSFDPFSDFSKLLMAGLMWIGRLEIVPVAVLLTRSYWRA
jgi:trk system potassium uptake protein TrkH